MRPSGRHCIRGDRRLLFRGRDSSGWRYASARHRRPQLADARCPPSRVVRCIHYCAMAARVYGPQRHCTRSLRRLLCVDRLPRPRVGRTLRCLPGAYDAPRGGNAAGQASGRRPRYAAACRNTARCRGGPDWGALGRCCCRAAPTGLGALRRVPHGRASERTSLPTLRPLRCRVRPPLRVDEQLHRPLEPPSVRAHHRLCVRAREHEAKSATKHTCAPTPTQQRRAAQLRGPRARRLRRAGACRGGTARTPAPAVITPVVNTATTHTLRLPPGSPVRRGASRGASSLNSRGLLCSSLPQSPCSARAACWMASFVGIGACASCMRHPASGLARARAACGIVCRDWWVRSALVELRRRRRSRRLAQCCTPRPRPPLTP